MAEPPIPSSPPSSAPGPGRSGPLDLASVSALGTVVGVWAHPDDEAYLAAGLMAALTDAGHRVVSVSATLGELGLADQPVEAARERRRAELAAALAAVGVTDVRVLGLSDGGCEAAETGPAVDAIAAVLDDVGPDTVLTFGPEGMTGHPDHRAVSRWTGAAVHRAAPGARLLHATMTPEHVRDTADLYARFDVMMAGEPPQTPRDALAVHLLLDGVPLERKVAALREHRSQTAGLVDAIGVEAYASFVAEEAFVAVALDRPVDSPHAAK